jgi:hypothetical protein
MGIWEFREKHELFFANNEIFRAGRRGAVNPVTLCPRCQQSDTGSVTCRRARIGALGARFGGLAGEVTLLPHCRNGRRNFSPGLRVWRLLPLPIQKRSVRRVSRVSGSAKVLSSLRIFPLPSVTHC